MSLFKCNFDPQRLLKQGYISGPFPYLYTLFGGVLPKEPLIYLYILFGLALRDTFYSLLDLNIGALNPSLTLTLTSSNYYMSPLSLSACFSH